MSEDKDTSAEPASPKEEEDKKVQAKRDEIRDLLEKKQLQDVLGIAFKIIADKDSRLLSDALDVIRQVDAENPSLIDTAQLQVVADFLNSDDDILRASAVLALKPVLLVKPDALYPKLISIMTETTSKNGREEAIRLLGLLGTDHPEKVEKLIPEFVACLVEDDVHVRKRSLEVLRLLSKTVPGKIEKELKRIAGKIADPEIQTGVTEVIAESIKNRELRSAAEKKATEEDKADLIPDVLPEPKKDETKEPEIKPVPDETKPEKPQMSEEEIKKEIGAKIQAEFSKIEEGVKATPSELKELKEIKTAQDLAPAPAAAKETEQAQPPAPVKEPQADLVKKQLDLKEKELQRREEEFKKLELEKKELELQAKELEMQREELKKAQLEQMELEVKRKEEELKQKELALKLKELEERERKLKEIEKTFQKDE